MANLPHQESEVGVEGDLLEESAKGCMPRGGLSS
jgi:hypothetical protein